MVQEVFPTDLTLNDFEVDKESFTAITYNYYASNNALLSIDLDIDENENGQSGVSILTCVQATRDDDFKVVDNFFIEFEYQGGSAWHTNDTKAHAKDFERAIKYVSETMPFIVEQANNALSAQYGNLYRGINDSTSRYDRDYDALKEEVLFWRNETDLVANVDDLVEVADIIANRIETTMDIAKLGYANNAEGSMELFDDVKSIVVNSR